jgi:hypothetical protein
MRLLASALVLVVLMGASACASAPVPNAALLPACSAEVLSIPERSFGGVPLEAVRDSLLRRELLDSSRRGATGAGDALA